MNHTKTVRMMAITVAVLATALASASAADVKEVWHNTCSKCHGADGSGHTVIGKKLGIKDFTDAQFQASLKDEDMLKALKEGIRKDGHLRMKPADELNDAEVKAMVAYVRSLKK